jgi:hypothetical protein
LPCPLFLLPSERAESLSLPLGSLTQGPRPSPWYWALRMGTLFIVGFAVFKLNSFGKQTRDHSPSDLPKGDMAKQ